MRLSAFSLSVVAATSMVFPIAATASVQFEEWYVSAPHIANYNRKNGEELVVSVLCKKPNTALWQVTHKLPKGKIEGAEDFLNMPSLVEKYNEGMLVRKLAVDDSRGFYDSGWMDASWTETSWGLERLVTKMWFQRRPIFKDGPTINRFLDEIEKGQDSLTVSYNRFLKDEVLYSSTFPLGRLESIVYGELYDHVVKCEYIG